LTEWQKKPATNPVAKQSHHQSHSEDHMFKKKKSPLGAGSSIAAGIARGLGGVALMAFAAMPASANTVFINELHYDNNGADVDEGVEIAGPAGTGLAGWSLALYDGASGALYQSLTLDGPIPDQQSGYGAIYYPLAGIQNGGTGTPDGLALVRGTSVMQLLSYEGVFTAVDGPAAGLTSVDIGAAETGTTPLGSSLQLTGTGNLYLDFSWNGPFAASPGTINPGQTFAPVPLPASLWLMGAGLIALGSGIHRSRRDS
jgi:hypothetical protein